MTKKLVTVLEDRYNELQEQMKEPEKHRPVPTGISDLDTILFGGLPRYPFYFALIGMAKGGKSTVELNLALNFCASSGQPVALYILEEINRQIADRVFARSSTLVDRSTLYQLALTEEHFRDMRETIEQFSNVPFYVNDTLFSIEAILADANKLGIKHIVIDNFQLMTGGGGNDERTRLVAQSKMLMRARQMGTTVFLVSQGNEKGESFGSTQVQMDADLVISIQPVHIDDKDRNSPYMENMRRLKVTRSRFCPQDSQCDIFFDGNHSRILHVPDKEPSDPDFIQLEMEKTK